MATEHVYERTGATRVLADYSRVSARTAGLKAADYPYLEQAGKHVASMLDDVSAETGLRVAVALAPALKDKRLYLAELVGADQAETAQEQLQRIDELMTPDQRNALHREIALAVGNVH